MTRLAPALCFASLLAAPAFADNGGMGTHLELFRNVQVGMPSCAANEQPGTIDFDVPGLNPQHRHLRIAADLCRWLQTSQQVAIAFYVKNGLIVGAGMNNEYAVGQNYATVSWTEEMPQP